MGGCQHTVICFLQICPNGIRTQITNTEFSKIFLKSIPVLQWARHATHQQYERLSQYPGTHGWGGVDYNSEFCFSFLVLKEESLDSSFIWISGGESLSHVSDGPRLV